jgi:hypothetical protein
MWTVAVLKITGLNAWSWSWSGGYERRGQPSAWCAVVGSSCWLPRGSRTTTSGTVSPTFAGLDVATGQMITTTTRRHRAAEFKAFLSTIDKTVPPELDVHVVLDNSSTQKTPEIYRWLLRPPALRPALHSDQQLMAQPRGTLVRGTHPPAPQTIRAPQRHRARDRPAGLDHDVEREPAALCLAQDRRRDPRHPRRILPTNLRLRSRGAWV